MLSLLFILGLCRLPGSPDMVVVAFLSLARILGRMFDYSFPACTFFFFFLVEVSSRPLIPFFMPGSVNSGSAS